MNAPNAGLRLLYFFGISWMVLNGLQALLTGIEGDEAYYWTFSRNLSWGYFDHPPMVALSIAGGELFGHGSFFTRLGTILFSAGTIWLGYYCIPPALRDVKRYLLLFASVVLFHVYGFIVTPDAGLLAFTALFFYAYRLFLQGDNLRNAALLGISVIGLMYSKYHGVLPVFFTVLSYPKILTRPLTWLAFAIGLAGFAPHLYWQWTHDFPTFRYHLSERIGSRYRIDKTTNYILGQLAIWGPFTTIPALYHFFKLRSPKDAYLRAHRFTFWGVLLFFLLNSFRSKIEPHWTLTAGISFLVLFNTVMHNASPRLQSIFTKLAWINIILLLLFRVAFMLPQSPLEKMPAFKAQFTAKGLADSLYAKAKGAPVVFPDSYTLPSLYMYYHPGEKAVGYPTVHSRKNHFNISGEERAFNGKEAWVALGEKRDSNAIEIPNAYQPVFLHKLQSFRAVNSVHLEWMDKKKSIGAGETVTVRLKCRAPIPIRTEGLRLNYIFIQTKKEFEEGTTPLVLQPGALGDGTDVLLQLRAPSRPGAYRLIFTIEQAPFGGSFASDFYKVEVL